MYFFHIGNIYNEGLNTVHAIQFTVHGLAKYKASLHIFFP